MPDLVPVDTQPEFDHSLVPVDHNPFADSLTMGVDPSTMNPIANVASGFASQFATLPQRAIDAGGQDIQNWNDPNYVPQTIGPAVETALTMMGGSGAVPAETNTLRSGASVIKSGMPSKSIFDEVAEKYPQIKIDGSMPRSPSDYGVLSRIEVPPELRGQGIATNAMNDIVAAADERGVNLALSPSGDFGGSPSRLKDFYSRFGFVPNKGANKDFATRESMLRPFAETNSATAGIGPAATPTIRAYHGSPHDFDAFDLSKIGTGEGAQAYGHGLYFAENPKVAEDYADKLGKPAISNDDLVSGNYNLGPLGHRYEVNINADPEHFLDWDKPLSEQPQSVQDLWAKQFQNDSPPIRADIPVTQGAYVPDARSGAEIYKNIADKSALQQAGIPGIKYLDQGSRAAGDGSRNYVVFNDKLINIIKKYGVAGLPAGYAAAASQQFVPVDHDPEF